MNGLSTSTVLHDNLKEPFTSSQLVDGSILSASSKRVNSLISKTYKQASELFLTRRLFEAFSNLEPILVPDHFEKISQADAGCEQRPLIAGASRKTRIKVWSLYLTLLSSIIDLGPEHGKNTFGSREWTRLVAMVRDGTIWEEVVRIGYKGIEGDVDAEVVINL